MRALTDDDVIAAMYPNGVDHAEVLSEGGSGARVLKVALGNEHQVLKYVAERPGLVDGHDSHSLMQKTLQIQYVRKHAPQLQQHYTDVLSAKASDQWVAMTSPFHDGATIGSLLTHGTPESFIEALRNVLSTLAARG